MFVNIHTHHLDAEDTLFIYNGVLDSFPPTAFLSLGVHPWQIADGNSKQLLMDLLPQFSNPRCIAIGECGVDRVHRPLVPDAEQTSLFLMHANIAQAMQKPMILHSVRAHDEILQLRKTFFKDSPAWILHGFHDSPERAQQLVKYQIYPSLGLKYLETAQRDNLLKIFEVGCFLETDDEKVSVAHCYKLLSERIGIPLQRVEADIFARFADLFHLPL